MSLRTIVQPDTEAIVPFIEATRTLLSDFPAAPVELANLGLFLFGSYTSTLDIQNALYALVPMEIGAVAGVALLIVGFSFGSLLLVVRLAFTVFASLCITFGLSAIVYVPGAFQDALKPLFPSLAVSSGIYFVIPPMVMCVMCELYVVCACWRGAHKYFLFFIIRLIIPALSPYCPSPFMDDRSILVGLGLDYDIFLMSRCVHVLAARRQNVLYVFYLQLSLLVPPICNRLSTAFRCAQCC